MKLPRFSRSIPIIRGRTKETGAVAVTNAPPEMLARALDLVAGPHNLLAATLMHSVVGTTALVGMIRAELLQRGVQTINLAQNAPAAPGSTNGGQPIAGAGGNGDSPS